MCVCVCVCVPEWGRDREGDRGSESGSALTAASQMQGLNLKSGAQPTESPTCSELFVFLLLSFKSSLYILDINPVSSVVIYGYFLPFCGQPFYSVHMVFWCTYIFYNFRILN